MHVVRKFDQTFMTNRASFQSLGNYLSMGRLRMGQDVTHVPLGEIKVHMWALRWMKKTQPNTLSLHFLGASNSKTAPTSRETTHTMQ